MKIFVIILNWNGKKDTEECLQSLEKQTDTNFSILIVDNGSTDDSHKELHTKFPDVQWLLNKQNEGFAKGNNLGIKQALDLGAEAVILLNNDTTLDKEWFAKLKQFFIENPNSITGCLVKNYFYPENLDHIGGIFCKKTANFILEGKNAKAFEYQNDLPNLDYVCGCSLLIPKNIIEKIGFLDERFFLIWEEADYCIRAKKSGFTIKFNPKAIIFHKISQSFTGKPHQSYFWWRNRLLFLLKHPELLENKSIWRIISSKETFKLIRHLILRIIQLPFSSEIQRRTKEEQIKKYRASLLGIKDFLCKRFGPAPDKIYKNSTRKSLQKKVENT